MRAPIFRYVIHFENVYGFDLFLFFFFCRLRLAETRRHHEAILHAYLDGLAVLNHEYVIFEGKERMGLAQNVYVKY